MKRYTCQCCGADLKRLKSNTVICEFCGSTFYLEDGEKIVDKDVTDHQVLSILMEAEKYRKINNTSAEIQELVKALEVNNDSEVIWTKLGRAYRCGNLYDKALECYEKAIKLNAEYGQSYCNIGAVAIMQKKYEKARTYYEKGLAYLDGTEYDYPVLLANYAFAIGLCGDKKKASQLLNEAEKRGYKDAKSVRNQLGIGLFSRFF
ncbi:MAG: Tetratricopeptide 2 repeat protein [Clostridia bacterium]|jgi:tetratricopeptide (TPR) repeat protein|nr:Tetratricopeptide 2 repeat protein [Clostridia bacterium]